MQPCAGPGAWALPRPVAGLGWIALLQLAPCSLQLHPTHGWALVPGRCDVAGRPAALRRWQFSDAFLPRLAINGSPCLARCHPLDEVALRNEPQYPTQPGQCSQCWCDALHGNIIVMGTHGCSSIMTHPGGVEPNATTTCITTYNTAPACTRAWGGATIGSHARGLWQQAVACMQGWASAACTAT